MKTITRNLSTAVVLTTSLLASSSLLAVQPGTRTPDQMVNLLIDKNALCPFYGFAVNQQINADGTVSPFSIPEGSSLLITGFDWYNYTKNGTNAMARWQGQLSIQGAAAAIIVSDFESGSGTVTQSGSLTGINDVVVKPGVSLCYGHPDWTSANIAANVVDVRANVHGYLVKNRGKNDSDDNDQGSSSRNRR